MPHVLTFKIRTIRPANHAYRKIVFTCTHILANIKFGVHIATFCVTNILSVYPNIGCRINTVEVQQYAFFFPTFGKGKVATIATHTVGQSIAHLDVGRIICEGIFYIDVERIPKTVHFQATWNHHLIPIRSIYIITVEFFSWHAEVISKMCPNKVPCTIECHPTRTQCGVKPSLFVTSITA